MVRGEKEQNKMPGSRNIEGKASGIIGELQKLSLQRKLGRVLYSVPRSWICDEKFETMEEFKQNYMSRVELQNN